MMVAREVAEEMLWPRADPFVLCTDNLFLDVCINRNLKL